MNFKLATQCYRYNFLLENFVVFSRTSTNFKFWIWMFPNYEKNCRKYKKNILNSIFKHEKKKRNKSCVAVCSANVVSHWQWIGVICDCVRLYAMHFRCKYNCNCDWKALNRDSMRLKQLRFSKYLIFHSTGFVAIDQQIRWYLWNDPNGH